LRRAMEGRRVSFRSAASSPSRSKVLGDMQFVLPSTNLLSAAESVLLRGRFFLMASNCGSQRGAELAWLPGGRGPAPGWNCARCKFLNVWTSRSHIEAVNIHDMLCLGSIRRIASVLGGFRTLRRPSVVDDTKV
jgi:hypothetical protein